MPLPCPERQSFADKMHTDKGFAFAKQGNKMRHLRCRTREGAEGLQKICMEKTLFPNAELNLLSPGSGSPLQAGTGHGRPGRAPGRC